MFLSASLFSLLNAFVLFCSASKKYIFNFYLGFIFFLIAIRGFASPNLDMNMASFLQVIFCFNSFPCFFLLGPSFYFYLRYEIIGTRFSFRKDFKYLLTFFLALMNMVPYYASSLDYKLHTIHAAELNHQINLQLNLLFLNSQWYFILGPIHTLIYLFSSLSLLKNHFKFEFQKLEWEGFAKKKKWLTIFFTCFFLFTLVNIASITYVFFTKNNLSTVTPIFSSLIFIYLNVSLYKFPQLVYGIKFYKSTNFVDLGVLRKKKYEVLMDDSIGINFKNQILVYQSTLAYLNPSFTYYDLIQDLNLPKYKVDHYFKNELKIKFIDYFNELRINYFVETITKEDLKRFKFQEIVIRFGFKNSLSFKKAFHKNKRESFHEFKKNLMA